MKIIYIIFFIYIIICATTIYLFDGTGDAGDSINHYLYAKYAFTHTELYFNHWAKPLFVLLASPFAQFGFVGMKVFNSILSILSVYFACKTAEELKIKNDKLLPLFMMFAPMFYILTFSGLTELLFAFFVSLSLFMAVRKEFFYSAILVSFMPFVRSEGLIFMLVFALFFALKKKGKAIPFLFLGHFVYSIVGYFFYGDFLWVFTKIPYQQLSSNYGSGELFHFAKQMIYVIGVPLYVLFWFGIISFIYRSFKKFVILEEKILVGLGFLSFFLSHTLFWYLGILHSMGLIRVLISVMPLIAIIALQGFNFISEELLGKFPLLKNLMKVSMALYILVFPFTHNPAAIHWKTDMMLNTDQKLAIQVAGFLKDKSNKNTRILFAHPYISELLGIYPFSFDKRTELSGKNIDEMRPSDLIVWESSFAYFEMNIKSEALDQNLDLKKIFEVSDAERGRNIRYAIYEKRMKSKL